MTLEKAVKQFKDDTLYIGSKSAFFFIGTNKEFEKEVKELSKYWKEKHKDTLANSKYVLQLHMKNKPKPGDKQYKKLTDFTHGGTYTKVIEYEELLKIWEAKKLALEKTIERNKNILKTFTSFDKRELLHCYRRIDGDGLVLVVEGYEIAKFWFKSEWDRYKRGDKVIIIGEGEAYEEELDD